MLTPFQIEALEYIVKGIGPRNYLVYNEDEDPSPYTTRPSYPRPVYTIFESIEEIKAIIEQAKSNIRQEIHIEANNSKNIPNCPVCKYPMILQYSPWSWFWGCPQFPACRGSRNYFCVYSLNDPDSKTPFYIGQTNNPERRFYQHLLSGSVRGDPDAWQNTASAKEKAIAALIKQGKEPICEILATCTERREVLKQEGAWIRKLLSEGIRLTNHIS